MSTLKRLFENLIPSLLLIAGLIVYDQYFRAKNQPAGPAPDPAVVKLGGEYGKALVSAAADTLEATAQANWSTTAEAVGQNRKQFQAKLEEAFKPIATELTRRFGQATDQPAAPATATALRAFCHDLAEGLGKGGK